jgi:hypothetical protein
MALAALLLAGLAPDGHRPAPAGEILARVSHVYRDPHQRQRAVATIALELLSLPEERYELRLKPSAVGPEIEPTPGFQGVRGANLRTALELDGLLADGSLAIETRPLDDGAALEGGLVSAIRGSLPVRVLARDGSIDWNARTPGSRVLELTLTSGPLPPGRHSTALRVRGNLRLAVEHGFDGERAWIGRVRDLPEPGEQPIPASLP